MIKTIIKIAIPIFMITAQTAVIIAQQWYLIPYCQDDDKTPWILFYQKKIYLQQKMVWACFEGESDKKDKNNQLKTTFRDMKVLSIDQLGNSLLLGDPDETISSRIGRIKRKWGGTIPWTRPVAKVTDWLLEIIDPGHSERAIEDDEGKDGLIDKPGNPYRLGRFEP